MDENIDRKKWIEILTKISEPVLTNMANDTLKKNMSIEYMDSIHIEHSYLEAVGRLICGIAPWMELGVDQTEEGQLRKKYLLLTKNGLKNIFNPESDDYLIFEGHTQPLVDAAFLAQGLLRAKTQLWDKFDDTLKKLIIDALTKTRSIKPFNNNWLLFASMIEAFLLETIGEYDEHRLMDGVNKFLNKWYLGDGFYSDGDSFHFDYYNSYVIHPMLTEILIILNKHGKCDEHTLNTQFDRLKTYSLHLERMISPEGTYPIIGRSMSYRTGVFHALTLSVLLGLDTDEIQPEQIRSALSVVIQRQFCDDNNFDERGWLKIGFNGHQKDIAEEYITTGSLYLCSTVFLVLGLPENDRFWSAPYSNWSSVKGWYGRDISLVKPKDK